MIEVSAYQSLGEALRDALVQFKSNTALIEMDRHREKSRYTYLEFKRAALPLARKLQDAGVGAGDRVAIMMSNQSKWLLSAYAVFYRGSVLVPIDYKLSPQEQCALLQHASVKVLITEFPLWKRMKNIPAPLAIVSEAPDSEDLPEGQRWESPTLNVEADFVPCARDDAATIVYSSGTGGRPKGCVLTHANYLAQYEALTKLFPVSEGDRFFSILPTNHAIDFMCGFLGPLFGGATVVHQRTLRAEFILDTMKRCEITHIALVPMLLEAFERSIREKLATQPKYKQGMVRALAFLNWTLTRTSPKPRLSRLLLKAIHDAFGGQLRLMFCGGAMVDQARAEFFYRLGLPVVIGYGLTEACTVVAVQDLKPFRADSVGRAAPGTQIRVVDADASGVGNVEVRGPTVMKEYYKDPQQSAEAIVQGWLRTGDMGRIDQDGYLRLSGRAKNMIVTSGGKNVYPEDIEGAFDGLPCEEFAVFASNYVWPKTKLSDEKLIALVRPSKGKRESVVDDLRVRNSKLPEYKRLQGILFWDQSFPRTASMKLKRSDLASELRDKAPTDLIQSL